MSSKPTDADGALRRLLAEGVIDGRRRDGRPVGALLGGLAGVLGGWWAGREIAHALTEDDDRFYRAQYEQGPDRLADRGYEQVRPAYVAGHLAGPGALSRAV